MKEVRREVRCMKAYKLCRNVLTSLHQGTHEFLSISNTSYNRTTFGCSSFLWILYSRRACLVVGWGRRSSEST